MTDMKTQENEASVDEFLSNVVPPRRREDGLALKAMIERLTGWPARMCGATIVGFGSYSFTYADGKPGNALVVGFSPRKANLVVYIMNGFNGYGELLTKLGKHKTGKCCLYINKLADIDQGVLEDLIQQSVAYMREKYGS